MLTSEAPDKTWGGQSGAGVRRWLAFNAVGALGILVQLATLMVLTGGLGLNYMVGTGLAVEISVVHNYFWHEQWTWSDRTSCRKTGRFRTFLRFNLANGSLSLIGNLILMRFLVGALKLDYVTGNLLAIGICSVLNFIAGDRFVFHADKAEPAADRPRKPGIDFARAGGLEEGKEMRKPIVDCGISRPLLVLAALVWATPVVGVDAAELQPATVTAWTSYVQATERRIASELSASKGFLAMDFRLPGDAIAERRAVMRGEIAVSKMVSSDPEGAGIRIPDGMIHHWRGSVLIRGAKLEDVLARVANPTAQETRQEDVLESKVLERGPDALNLYLKLQRSKLVTVVYNTEHHVRYFRYGATRAASRSVATKIAELENPFTLEERERPQGRDHGFLWKLNSYWRYEQVEGGLIVECESISLSRTVPAFLAYLIRPLIDRVARESMQRTLGSMRERFTHARDKSSA